MGKKQRGNPGCGWFLVFWGVILAACLVANELFGSVSLLDKLQEKWELAGEKTKERRGH